jgi:hypothetical protein
MKFVIKTNGKIDRAASIAAFDSYLTSIEEAEKAVEKKLVILSESQVQTFNERMKGFSEKKPANVAMVKAILHHVILQSEEISFEGGMKKADKIFALYKEQEKFSSRVGKSGGYWLKEEDNEEIFEDFNKDFT